MKERFDALSVLRWAAAFHVLMHHYAEGLIVRGPGALATAVHHGRFSLSLFFVMSGFVISYRYVDELESGKVTRWDFWRARFARLVPLYFASWLIEIPIRIAHGILRPADFAIDTAAYFSMTQAWVRHPSFGANGPAWTISTEVAFYALLPFIAAFYARGGRRRLVLAALGSVVLAVGPHVLAALRPLDRLVPHTTANGWTWALTRFPPLRASEFLLGLALGRLRVLDGKSSPKRLGICVGLGAVASVIALQIPPTNEAYGALANAAAIPASALLVYGLSHLRPRVIPRVLVGLAEASYAIYILQAPVYRYVAEFGGLPADTSPWFFPVYVLLLLPLALAAHRLLERPANAYLRGRKAIWLHPSLPPSP